MQTLVERIDQEKTIFQPPHLPTWRNLRIPLVQTRWNEPKKILKTIIFKVKSI